MIEGSIFWHGKRDQAGLKADLEALLSRLKGKFELVRFSPIKS